jgi:hypothetical protein
MKLKCQKAELVETAGHPERTHWRFEFVGLTSGFKDQTSPQFRASQIVVYVPFAQGQLYQIGQVYDVVLTPVVEQAVTLLTPVPEVKDTTEPQ